MTLLFIYIISIFASYSLMVATGDDIDKKLEEEHLKKYKEENAYRYLIPIIPSLIPVLNIVISAHLQKKFDETYNMVKEIKCRTLMNEDLEKTYDSLTEFKREEFKEDFCKSIDLLKDEDTKEKVLYTINKKYSDPDIEYFEYNKETKNLEVVDDDYLEEKPKVKKLVF